MPGHFFPSWFTTMFVALISVILNTTVNAEYNYQPVSYQTTSFHSSTNHYQAQHHLAHQQVFEPPAIMPYIPFDDEPITQQVQPTFTQPATHHQSTAGQYQPVTHNHQPQGKTWRHNPARTSPALLSNARQRVLQAANRQLGVRYRWGGNTPRQGFDCSGFTKHAMRGSNIKIPRTAAQQSRASRTIKRSQLRPGDMIFFKTKGRYVNHVGIYLGNGRFIHAASGGGKVMTDDLRKTYWQKRLHKYGTFFG